MRIVLHLDMDYFFAQIEERENPSLKGKPVVVGADPKKGRGRGVVSTANYEARKFGIKSGMPISHAWRFCPKAIFLPVDWPLYSYISERIMKILRPFGDAFEQVSVDEAFLDISLQKSYTKATEIAQKIKQEIKKKERLTCSVGIGPNKLVAKIASGFKKPDGLIVVTPDKVQEFLDPLDIIEIPGIGPKTAHKLYSAGIKTIKELRAFHKADLEEMFGKWGAEMYESARGRDESLVTEEHEVKSIGRQITFEKDTRNQALITKTILNLTEEVFIEAQNTNFPIRTVTIIIRHSNFETHTKAHTSKESIENIETVNAEVLRLLFPFLKQKKFMRLVGVRVS